MVGYRGHTVFIHMFEWVGMVDCCMIRCLGFWVVGFVGYLVNRVDFFIHHLERWWVDLMDGVVGAM